MLERRPADDRPDDATQTPTAGDQIPNLGLVKAQIRAYYGDTVGDDGRHHFSETSVWAAEVAAVIDEAGSHISSRLQDQVVKPAIVLDVDDTALATYPYLANTGFGTRQNREVLPAVGPTRDLACQVHEWGVAVFFVSVRREHRRTDTMQNLRHAGYPEAAGLYLLPTAPADLSRSGAPDGALSEFKTRARAHIESEGFTILASIGDQVSDLTGGHAERTFKLPNPMYYTP